MVRLLSKYVFSGYGMAFSWTKITLFEYTTHILDNFICFFRKKIILFLDSSSCTPFLAATASVNFSEPWGPICYSVTFLSAIGPMSFLLNTFYFLCMFLCKFRMLIYSIMTVFVGGGH